MRLVEMVGETSFRRVVTLLIAYVFFPVLPLRILLLVNFVSFLTNTRTAFQDKITSAFIDNDACRHGYYFIWYSCTRLVADMSQTKSLIPRKYPLFQTPWHLKKTLFDGLNNVQ